MSGEGTARPDAPARICVLGSLNMDLVMRAPRFPKPGETLLGGPFEAFPGGKGANQAVAAARMGASVRMIGAVGRDAYGERMLAVLRQEGVDTTWVQARKGLATGVASITVDAQGENQIVVAPGANASLTLEDVERAVPAITGSDVLVAQLEIPLFVLEQALEVARGANVGTLVNAAPAQPLARRTLQWIDVLVVNELEARVLANRPAASSPADLARALNALGPRSVVLTLGAGGALWCSGDELVEREAHAVEAVDTTACGDAFVGALAAATGSGNDPRQRLRLACAAGALAATCRGAMSSLPRRAEVERLLAR